MRELYITVMYDPPKLFADECSLGPVVQCSPLHACKRCKKEGGEAGTPQELVPCRLCPKAYHVACLSKHLGDKHAVPRRVWLVERDAAGIWQSCA